MKRFFLLLMPILVISVAGMIIFGMIQIRYVEEKMTDDLRRKSKTVAESIAASSRRLFLKYDEREAGRLVETFQQRERLQGCVLYDSTGRLLVMTDRIRSWQETPKPYLRDVITRKNPFSGMMPFEAGTAHVYSMPVLDDDRAVIGIVEIVYDTSYLYPILASSWRRLAILLSVMVLCIVATLLLIQHRIFTLPIRRLTDWFALFQKGEINDGHPIHGTDELGKLASEVEQLALSLRVARKSISKEADIRLKREDRWTETRLKNLIHAKLGINTFFVVSNREPFVHVMNPLTKQPHCVRPASGVVTAIDPILRASGGTWIAHGSGDADRQFVNSKNKLGVPPQDDRYILKRVWLSKAEEDGYYYGFSNEGIWPLCHMTHTRPIFREDNWRMYQKVNRKFADAVLEELPRNNPYIFIQDYHFMLLGRMIKEARPDAHVALFWHIPWPNPEVVAICPYHQEMLDGMLGCDLIGFHVQVHCNNFMDTANRLLECRLDTEKFSVIRRGKETFVRAFPISIDDSPDRLSPGPQTDIERIRKEHDLQDKIIALGVDRIDYTKGLIERILAVDRLLEKYPEYKNRFVFIQLAAPSRTHIKRYHDLGGEIEELVEKKNWKYSEGSWKPILLFKRHFTPEEIQPFYAMADLCVVSSLHDGMNLVAKEYVMARSDLNGVLVLSLFTGAARELTDAVPVNPYSIEDFADRLREAIEMPEAEKRRRMQRMRRVVKDYNIFRWAGEIISEWTSLRIA